MTWGDQLISCPTAMEVPELERRPYLDRESFRQTIADVPSFCLQAEMPINEKQQKFLFSPSFLSFSLFPFYANSVLWASFLPSFSSMRDIRLSDFWVRFLSPDKNCFFQTQEIRKKLRSFIGGSGCLLVVERTLRDRELVGSNLTDY